MLKKIPVAQVRMGMHLHGLEGAWMDHPFWKSKFTIDDAALLRKLHDSGVKECWIDVAKGLDVAAPEATPTAPTPAPTAAAPAAAPATPAQPPPPASTSMQEELQQAAAICNRGKQAVTAMFREARLGRAVDAESCVPLVDEIANSVMRNPGALVSLARLKSQDEYTYMHSVAVCALMVALGRELGMSDAECRLAGLAGLTHDLGKALMPLEVLNKPGKLTEQEFAVMRGHPERGHELLLEGRGAGPEVLDVCLHHHERIDGSGYPHRISGEAFTRIARMGSICDVYDAITSNRPYKSGWDPAESIARMASWKGHFDTTLFAHFVRSLGIYPVGALVRMHSGRLAVVVEQNAAAPTAPVVKVFFSTKANMPIVPKLLDLSSPCCSDRIVGREPAAQWGFKHLDEMWAADALEQR